MKKAKVKEKVWRNSRQIGGDIRSIYNGREGV